MPPLNARGLLLSLAALTAVLLVALAVCASIGSSGYTAIDLLRGAGGGADERARDMAAVMILRVRMPRLLLAAIAGAALGAAGTAFQAVLRNPLADPYILGISGGAALAAIAVTAAGLPALLPALPVREVAAFLGAVATLAIIVLLASVRGRIASYPMLLIGVVMNAIYLGLILFIETAVEFTRIQGVMMWMVGNVPTESYRLIGLLAVVLVLGVAGLWALGRPLNVLSAGEEVARTLGVQVERVRVAAILVASLVVAAVVSVTGLIGFVGLIVPHSARLVFGPDHRLLVPASALTGAIFLMVADTAARTLMAPTELPVGVLTVLCGGPLFLWLYRRHRGMTYFD
ncbi:MAG: FecCD family ABC transporter permease [Acidobacteriota bacterium]